MSLRELAAAITPGPWAWRQMMWPNERCTLLHSETAFYEDYKGVPRSVLRRIDHCSDSDSLAISLVPDLLVLTADLADALRYPASGECGAEEDALDGTPHDKCFCCDCRALLARVAAVEGRAAK